MRRNKQRHQWIKTGFFSNLNGIDMLWVLTWRAPLIVLHLWEACTESLQRSLHHAGAGVISDHEQLLNIIKTLAVKKHNNLVNILKLQKMGQEKGETMSAYSARLNGQAIVNVNCIETTNDKPGDNVAKNWTKYCYFHQFLICSRGNIGMLLQQRIKL